MLHALQQCCGCALVVRRHYSWRLLLCSQPASIPHAILLQALAALNSLLGGSSEVLAPAAPALVPAVCKGLDSSNPSVRQVGGQGDPSPWPQRLKCCTAHLDESR